MSAAHWLALAACLAVIGVCLIGRALWRAAGLSEQRSNWKE